MKKRLYKITASNGESFEVSSNNPVSAVDKFLRKHPDLKVDGVNFSQWVDAASMSWHNAQRYKNVIW